MFAQKFNPLTGNVEWIEIHDVESSAVPGLANSLYLDMLTDHRRNCAYAACLEDFIRPGQHILDIGTGTGLLAMLAARYSLLSSSGSSKPLITACEVYPAMVQLAHQLVAQNQLSDMITICQKRSDELLVSPPSSSTLSDSAAIAPGSTEHRSDTNMTSVAAKRKKHAAAHQTANAAAAASIDMPRKADVIVTEIFDSELLGEGILPTMRHAVEYLLQVVL